MDISNRLPRLALALAALVPAACETPESATSLNAEGPPMLRQVFMLEADATGRNETVLAFGIHPDVPAMRTRTVARAAPLKNNMRVVFDELLIGNYLEEVQCSTNWNGTNVPRFQDCPAWSRVPEGATPDDIAHCASPDGIDELCTGAFAVCMTADGKACGIADEESASRPSDGAPDALRLIDGVAKLRCGTIEVGFNVDTSFWQPSGNQLVPAGRTPENSLGPALVLKPLNDVLPTSQSDCELVLASSVVDKDHIRVCAPAGGDLANDCEPGDMSAFSFGTDVLRVTSTNPADQAEGVALMTVITIRLNTAVDDTRLLQDIVLLEGGVARNDYIVQRSGADRNVIEIGLPDGPDTGTQIDRLPLQPNTTYTVTATIRDTFGVAAPAPITFTFTTTGA